MHLKRQNFSYSSSVKSFKPIDFFIHPLPLIAVVLTALNDHFFKYQYPGLITGKLSDFTGLFYFPLFLSALIVLKMRLYRKDFVLNRSLLVGAIVVTDLLFVLFKLNMGFKNLFVQWFSNRVFAIAVESDPTDLVALLSSVACYGFASRYFEKTNVG